MGSHQLFVAGATMASRKRKRKTTFTSRKRPRRAEAAVMVTNPRVGGFLGFENKFLDLEVTDDAFATSWAAMNPASSVDCISAVAQGDGESNRDGRVYFINSIHLRGTIDMPVAESAAAPRSDVYARIALVWDTQANAATVTATDVMDGGQTEDWLAFRNLQNTKRFRVLKDMTRRIVVSQQMNEGAVNLFASTGAIVPWTMNVRFKKPVKVTCVGTTGVIASISDNAFHVIGCANSTVCELNYQSRIRFTG